MRLTVVTGVSGPVGQHLLVHLGRGGAGRVVGLDVKPSPLRPPHLELIAADVATAELDGLFTGADAVVHLAWLPVARRQAGSRVRRGGAGWPVPDGGAGAAAPAAVEGTRRVLDAADRAGVRSVVHVSSACVYGAWADNALPLTEEAALRPNPGMIDAAHHAEAERVVADWADSHPAAAVAVLRPATVLGTGVDTWLSRSLGGQPRLRSSRTDPARQFVHVDDVASAVALALRERLDGVFNVAADGWIPAEVVRGLSAGGLKLAVPGRLAELLARWAWSLHLSDVSPDLLPLTEHPWVVANDRLRAAGWAPQHSNEDAVVAGRPGSRWREMGPSRRQQVALAGSGAVLAAGAAGTAVAVARARSRRRG